MDDYDERAPAKAPAAPGAGEGASREPWSEPKPVVEQQDTHTATTQELASGNQDSSREESNPWEAITVKGVEMWGNPFPSKSNQAPGAAHTPRDASPEPDWGDSPQHSLADALDDPTTTAAEAIDLAAELKKEESLA